MHIVIRYSKKEEIYDRLARVASPEVKRRADGKAEKLDD